jgi:hypothetical protein
VLKIFGRVSAAAMTVALASCSSLPEQSEMTGVDIVDIIMNVRCELKDAIAHYPASHPINKMFIGYGFTFTSLEDNVEAGAGSLVIPIAHGNFTIGFDAGESRHREGEKTIDLAEQIGNVRTLDCSRTNRVDSHKYPVLGRVGLTEVVGRYATLDAQNGLQIGGYKSNLYYWLDLSAGVHPSVKITPLSGHDRDFSANFSAHRKDAHRLLITISAPARRSVTRVEIVNWPEGVTAPRAEGPAEKSGVRAPAARESAPPNGRENALRDLQYERSLKIQQDILDRLK